jgi:hypothetical protein
MRTAFAAPAESASGAAPPGTYTQQQAIADGYLTETTVPLNGGGVSNNYQTSSGQSFSIANPPAGFSPLTASPAQLTEYGFPARPSGGTALQNWLTAMSDYTGTPTPQLVFKIGNDQAINSSEPVPSSSPSPASYSGASPAGPPFSSTILDGSNWGGYVSANSNDTAFVGVQGTTSVPQWATPYCPNNSDGYPPRTSIWTGIGGDSGLDQGSGGDGNLIQSGIDVNNIEHDGIVPFWEKITAAGGGPGPEEIANAGIRLASGDAVYIQTSYESSDQNANFFVEDETTGQVAQLSGYVPSSYYDGSTAEWITEEMHEIDGNPIALKNFQSFGWYSAQAEMNDGNWKTINQNTNYKLYSDYTAVSNFPSALGSGGQSFTNNWENCF